MVHTFTGRGAKRYRYYKCSHAIQSGSRSCPSPVLRASEIEGVVVDHIRCIAGNKDLQAEVFKQAQVQAKERLSRLRLERTQLKRELSRLYAEGRQGSPDQNGATLLDLQERITRAVNRMVELDQRIAAMESEDVSQEDVATAFSQFRGGLGHAESPRTKPIGGLIDFARGIRSRRKQH